MPQFSLTYLKEEHYNFRIKFFIHKKTQGFIDKKDIFLSFQFYIDEGRARILAAYWS